MQGSLENTAIGSTVDQINDQTGSIKIQVENNTSIGFGTHEASFGGPYFVGTQQKSRENLTKLMDEASSESPYAGADFSQDP